MQKKKQQQQQQETPNTGRFLLIYGSVTSKAESIAELIAEEAGKRGLQAEVHCMSQIGKKVFKKTPL